MRIERITHSLCTLEFEDHRPLYDWFLDNIPAPCHPRQIEFARGNLNYTVMSKRRLRELVEEGHVHGWDDPRMPTLAGLRRRGYTPARHPAVLGRDGCLQVGQHYRHGGAGKCRAQRPECTVPRAPWRCWTRSRWC